MTYEPSYTQRAIASALPLTAQEIAEVVMDLRRMFPTAAHLPILTAFYDAFVLRYDLVGLERHALDAVMFAGLQEGAPTA